MAIKIGLKSGKKGFIEVADHKLKIDYPSMDQSDKLQDLQYDLYVKYGEHFEKDGMKFKKTTPLEVKAEAVKIDRQYNRLLLKYSIKDWGDIKDESGKAIPCIINETAEGTELSKESYEIYSRFLENNPSLYAEVIEAIVKEIKYTQVDKKK